MAAEIDLENMTMDELKTLAKEIEKAIKGAEAKNLKMARDAAEAAARQFGFSLDEVVGRPIAAAAKHSEAKYRNPDNPQQTWTGRGRQPQWFKDAVAGGRAPKELAA
jgi:DNA-binding protein H-NS